MPSVIDDPASRLYAGALLGKALSKQIGVSGGEQTSHAFGARAATLQAGVASGKIKPSQLSASDASLLGSALGAKPKPAGGLLGVLNDITRPIGKFGGEALTAAESLKGLPAALGTEALNLFKPKGVIASGREPKQPIVEGLKRFPGEFAQSITHPTEHPFQTFINVGAVASGGLGALSKGALALNKAGRFAEGARGAGILKKALDLGSPTGRPGVIVSPGFGGEAAGEGLSPQIFSRQYATARPFTKYAVQKPLDFAVSQLQRLPTVGPKLTDIQGGYYGRKLIAKTHAQETAGAHEAFLHHPVQALSKATQKMYDTGQTAGQYQFEATMLHSMGINTLDKLDEYAKQIQKGEDVDGVIMTPAMKKMANYRATKLYQDPRFRQLIEKPTNEMKEVAFHMRRANVENARLLDIAPQVSEDAAFGRLRELTGKTNEELRAELPKSMQPQGEFAKGLYALQQSILGESTAETIPSVGQLAHVLPYGTVEQRTGIITRAVESLKADVENVGDVYERHQTPGYLPGNNLFDKVANALQGQLGVDPEQAQAFTRGVALGSAEGPILPTYIPSVTGERLQFGIRPDRILSRVGRTLGVAKFRSLTDYEKQPTYFDIKRPYSPRTISAQTLGRGPRMNYLKEANYGSFMTGAQRVDPETIIRNSYHVSKDLVQDKLNPAMLEKLQVPNPDSETGHWSGPAELLQKLGDKAGLYTFVPVNMYRSFFTNQHELLVRVAGAMKDKTGTELQYEIEKLAEESAQKFVSDETHGVATGNTQGLALPTTFVRNIIQHARLSEQATGIGRVTSTLVQTWKTMILSFSPSWFFRTSVGHGLIALIDGTINPGYWFKSHSYFAEGRPVLDEHLRAVKWGERYGDTMLHPEPLPYGVNQGGMRQELGDIQEGPHGLGGLPQLPIAKQISKAVHVQNNFQRRAIFLRKLDVGAKQRMAELNIAFDHPGGFWNSKNIDAVMDPAWRASVLQYPDLVEHALDQLSKVSYTFSQMNAWERQLVRHGIPFYGWLRFVKIFTYGLPLKYPGRAQALYLLGKIGEGVNESMGPMPDYLSGALWLDHSDMAHARYVNLYGLNPFETGGENPLGLAAFGKMSPLVQAVVSGMGIDPLTGHPQRFDPRTGIQPGRHGELIDTRTGREVNIRDINPIQRAIGTFLRSFPEIRTVETALTGGNPVYPESIPFLDEHPIGVNPQTRRNNTIESLFGQELGVQMRRYDLGKYQARLLREATAARGANVKAIRKANEKLGTK